MIKKIIGAALILLAFAAMLFKTCQECGIEVLEPLGVVIGFATLTWLGVRLLFGK